MPKTLSEIKLLKEGKLKQYTQAILRKYAVSLKKKLGQNFLTDIRAIDTIIEASNIKSTDTIIEVGPGIGTLTYFLLEKGKKVIVYEIDPLLSSIIKREFHSFSDRLEVINTDVLTQSFPPHDKLFSNVPFVISSPLLELICGQTILPNQISLLMQKEFVEHLCSKPNSPSYSKLSVYTSFFYKFRLIDNFPPQSFYPKPKVFSSLVLGNSLSVPPIVREKDFRDFLNCFFTRKHRKIINNIIPYFTKRLLLSKKEIRSSLHDVSDINRRPVDMSPNEILALYLELRKLFL